MKIVHKFSIATLLTFLSFSSYAAEVSFVTGGISGSSVETTANDNTTEVDSMAIEFSGRYLSNFDSESAVYYYAGIGIYTFDGDTPPDDYMSLSLGMGSRFFGSEFTPRIRPYLSAYGEFETFKNQDLVNGVTTEISGLNYGITLGFKFNFYETLFLELESNLFEANLFQTTTVESNNTKTEETSFELFAKSFEDGAIGKMAIAIGMAL